MARRKIPVTIYLEPEYHKALEAIAAQYQKSISMAGKDLLLKSLETEHRPLTVNERLDRLEQAVEEIRDFLKMGSGDDKGEQSAKPKATTKAKPKT